MVGDLSGLRVVEIWGGYGGQCKILADALGFGSCTMIDLPECLPLAEKYLTLQGVEGVSFIHNHSLDDVGPADLVISNYAFSVIEGTEQLKYLEQVIAKSRLGYMTLNFISDHLKSLSLEDIIRFLRTSGFRGKVEREYPLTHSKNVILKWDAKKPSSLHPSFSLPKCPQGVQQKRAVVYEVPSGRLGDKLLAYFHAKWVAYRYDLPFLYTPFEKAELFQLSTRDQELGAGHRFGKPVKIKNLEEIDLSGQAKLYVIPYFPEARFEREMHYHPDRPYFQVDWEDPEFRNEMVACLTPREKVKPLNLPQNCVTVGVHVRREEAPDVFRTFPLKFPNDTYYVRQLETVAKIFKDQPIYVHVFTDLRQPTRVVRALRKRLKGYDLEFGYRKQGNGPDVNILDDFIDLQKFDYLIIPQSNFSLIVSKLKEYAMSRQHMLQMLMGSMRSMAWISFLTPVCYRTRG